MIQRIQLQQVKFRINEERKFIQVIMGPRQVGKTTLVNQLLQQIDMDYHFVSADAVLGSNIVWIEQVWETARMKLRQSKTQELLLVIDEVQKIPNWSEYIKQQWDKDTYEKTNIKVILLGSSRLLIQRGLTESLAGRFETIYLGHWSYAEMRTAFGWDVDQYIYFGAYPGTASLINDEERWKNYVKDALIETSISKDILMLTRVDKPAILKRLFELGSLYSGQILSYTKILGQLQDSGNTTTLSHYLQLLSDSGLLGGIEKFAGDVVRIRSSSPKFQVFNNALFTAQDIYSFQSAKMKPEYWGRLVESAIGSHLLNNSYSERFNLYYWRENNKEVDFILEKDRKLISIEVKSGKRSENKGMSQFSQKFNPKRTLLIGAGGISVEEFLNINPVELF